MTDTKITAPVVNTGANFKIGSNSSIKADEVIIGDNVVIGNDVEIVCDRLELGNGCKIGNGSTIMAPEIVLEEGASIGKNVEAELNLYLRIGKFSLIGHRVVIAGQGMSAGEFLWLKNDVIIGGGGCSGPNSYLKMGDRVSVFDRVYINLSEEVTIGSDTALSYNAVLLTHSSWQPALMGYFTKFAPISIGSHCVVYLNSVVLPGVKIGDYTTIGAQSLVNKNIPAYSLASGNPARVIVGDGYYPRAINETETDDLMKAVLRDYATTLGVKGVEVTAVDESGPFTISLVYEGAAYTITYYSYEEKENAQAAANDITISHAAIADAQKGAAHFDLKAMTVSGEPGAIGEDLRDYLRRRAIRISTGKPFKTIPLANVKRIRAKRSNS